MLFAAAVDRELGLVHELLGLRAVLGKYRCAHQRSDGDLVVVDHHRLDQMVADAFGNGLRQGRV